MKTIESLHVGQLVYIATPNSSDYQMALVAIVHLNQNTRSPEYVLELAGQPQTRIWFNAKGEEITTQTPCRTIETDLQGVESTILVALHRSLALKSIRAITQACEISNSATKAGMLQRLEELQTLLDQAKARVNQL